MPPNPYAPRPRRATIEDVAAAANVSVATVSRALRGLPNVSTSTRKRVQAAAEELRYRADPAASRLAAGVSRSIGVAVPSLSGWYFSNVMAGAESVCNDAGYDTIVLGLGTEEQWHRLVHNTDSIHRRVDGVIIVDVAMPTDDLRTILDSGLPVVTIGRRSPMCSSVGINDREVGAIAATHLFGLGHRRIGVIGGGDDDPTGTAVPQERRRGFEQAAFELGMPIEPEHYRDGRFSLAGGRAAALSLLESPERPTAIFAMSDEMAFGTIQAARSLGIRIPDELSVLGVDDHDLAALVDLTTIRQDVPGHGARAARILLDHLLLVDQQHHEVFGEVALVERATTAPPMTAPT